MLLVKVTNRGTAVVNALPAGGVTYFGLNHACRLNTNANGDIVSTVGTANSAFTASADIQIQYGSLTDGGYFRVMLQSAL